ncbi:hypothetical protein [Sulfolobus tengchongensis spindle-shaped virus 3]|nr:hypothetical protein [Sulfolobus tengchongensis spindle-shaped virus 3]
MLYLTIAGICSFFKNMYASSSLSSLSVLSVI